MDILRELDEAFDSDPAINELGFMYGYEGGNVVLVAEEHKLGISTKCLKPLFIYAMQKLRTTSHSNPVNNIHDTLSLTRAGLIVRGDNPFLLHIRKRLLLLKSSHFSAQEELHFLSLLFHIHPKSPSCWEHRRFCLRILYPSTPSCQDILLPLSVVERELLLCERMAELYPRNYYAWMHRVWILRLHDKSESFVEAELLFIKRWLTSHPSDHSATHYYHLILNQRLELLRSSRDLSERLLHEEFRANEAMLKLYPAMENVWLQRRSLLTLLLKTNCTFISSSVKESDSEQCESLRKLRHLLEPLLARTRESTSDDLVGRRSILEGVRREDSARTFNFTDVLYAVDKEVKHLDLLLTEGQGLNSIFSDKEERTVHEHYHRYLRFILSKVSSPMT